MKISQNFKKSKKVLLGVGLLSLATLGFTIASCATASQLQKGFFPSAANNVYNELLMTGKTLDEAGYKSKDGKKFEQKAIEENEKVKKFISAISVKLKEQNLIKDDTTALFLKNYNFQYSENNDQLLKNLNNFSMEQPILYSQLYANSDTQNSIPNLGIKFPVPLNDSGMQYFDDWFEIGAAANTPNTGSLLAKNWKGTADYVFYLYDSSLMTPEQETKLKQFIFKKEDVNFTPWTLLKNDASVKKVIPLDLQYFYNGTWDLIGTQHIVKQISLILAAVKEQNLNQDRSDIDQAKLNNDQVYQTIKAESDKSTFNPTPVTDANKLTPPTDGVGMHLGSSGFNSLAHLISLGIMPDYVEYNAKSNEAKQHIFYSGYLTKYMPANPTDSMMLPFGFAKDANSPDHKAIATTKKLYSVVADRSKYGSVASKWTFENPIIDASIKTAKGLGWLMNENAIKKAIFTERNDSSLTQFTLTSGFILYNTQLKQSINQSDYVKTNKYLN